MFERQRETEKVRACVKESMCRRERVLYMYVDTFCFSLGCNILDILGGVSDPFEDEWSFLPPIECLCQGECQCLHDIPRVENPFEGEVHMDERNTDPERATLILRAFDELIKQQGRRVAHITLTQTLGTNYLSELLKTIHI
jgi:hypothetical protein